ncbi:molybdopterin molybdotransferase MoeA [Cryobacterium sp. TMT1-2-2]|uniref:molybdopterin molybdotransferase MoeA n=1 Tax=Cryobacterium sp. TMT1-2-2 TaxID=1259233 RepID=UPI00106CF926|nr:gephyrin-like molybdotransferase Glp [Cryobacterium sp. TMT1-2-2]TFD13459.1 molybdopterin molybdotransferase MoeA [Cryobacterium sp. TMT1-2-2]
MTDNERHAASSEAPASTDATGSSDSREVTSGHRENDHAHPDRADACAPAATARTVSEQLAVVLGSVAPLLPVRVELDAARGLVLAEDVLTVTDTPPFDNSAMDGYAVIRADLLGASAQNPITLPVVADLAAGTAENPRLVPGQVARIMTGAPIPDGADAVVPIEDTDQGTELVTIVQAPNVAAHVRRAGEDAHAGDRVLRAGSVLWPTRVAAAASAGTSSVLVHPAPRVAVISTGSELVTPGSPTRRGQIPDSNSFLLSAAVAEAGGIPVRIGAEPDDDDVLRALLTELAGTVDVIVLSGGVSVGAYDVVKAVLKPLGTVDFGPVKMQPGKPQGFGRWPATGDVPGPLIFALPGNPVSAYVSFEVFVRPALRRLLGHGLADPIDPADETATAPNDGAMRTDTEAPTVGTIATSLDQPSPDHPALHRRTITATVADGWNSPPGRAQYMPVIVTHRTVIEHAPAVITAEGSTSASTGSIRSEVRPASRGGSGSHLVAGLAQANGLAIVPEDTTHIRGGDRVTVMLTS